MLLPRDVILEILASGELPGDKDGLHEVIERRYIHSVPGALETVCRAAFAYAVSPRALALHAVRRWRSTITAWHYQYYLIHQRAQRVQGDVAGDYGEILASTNNYQMLHHALYLYHLDSWGVGGDVLECGSFKGLSAAFLSWPCKVLGRRLYVADSFEGLPATMTEVERAAYKPGSYAGSVEEVKKVIDAFGCIDVCDFLVGYFENTLPFKRLHLAMIWADVDLDYSMTGVLNHQEPNLGHEGIIISDEVTADHLAEDGQIRDDATLAAAAVGRYFKARGVPVRGVNFGMGNSVIVRAPLGHLLYEAGDVSGVLIQ